MRVEILKSKLGLQKLPPPGYSVFWERTLEDHLVSAELYSEAKNEYKFRLGLFMTASFSIAGDQVTFDHEDEMVFETFVEEIATYELDTDPLFKES